MAFNLQSASSFSFVYAAGTETLNSVLPGQTCLLCAWLKHVYLPTASAEAGTNVLFPHAGASVFETKRGEISF